MEKLVAKFKSTALKKQLAFLQSHRTQLNMTFYNSCFEEIQNFLVYYSDQTTTTDDHFAATLLDFFFTSCQSRIELREHRSTDMRHMFNKLLSKKTHVAVEFLTQFLNYLQILRIQDHPEDAAAYYQSIQHYLQINNSQKSINMLFDWLLQFFDLFKLKFLLNCITPLIIQKEMYADVINWVSAFISAAVITYYKGKKQYVAEEFNLCQFAIRQADELLKNYSDFQADTFLTFIDSPDLTLQILKIMENCSFRLGDDPICLALNVYGMLYLLDNPMYQQHISRILISYMHHKNYVSPQQSQHVEMYYLAQQKIKFSLDNLTPDQEDLVALAVYVFNRSFEIIALTHFTLFLNSNINKLVNFFTSINQVISNSPDFNSFFNPTYAYQIYQVLQLVILFKLQRPLDQFLQNNQLPEFLNNQNLINQLMNSTGELFRRFFIQSCCVIMRLYSGNFQMEVEPHATFGQKYDEQRQRLSKFNIYSKTYKFSKFSVYYQPICNLAQFTTQDLLSLIDLYPGFCFQCISGRTINAHINFTKLITNNILNDCLQSFLNKQILIDFAYLCHNISKKYGSHSSKLATFNILSRFVLICRQDISLLKKQVLEKVLIRELTTYLNNTQELGHSEIFELGSCIVNIIENFDVSEEQEFVNGFKQLLKDLDTNDIAVASVYIQLYRYYVKFSEFEINKSIHDKLLQMLNADYLDAASDDQFKNIIYELKALLIMVVQQENFTDFKQQFQAFLAIYMFPEKLQLLSSKKQQSYNQLLLISQLVFDITLYLKIFDIEQIVPLTELRQATIAINSNQLISFQQRYVISQFFVMALLCFEDEYLLLENISYGFDISSLFGKLKHQNKQYSLQQSLFLLALAIPEMLVTALFQVDSKYIIKVTSIAGNEFFLVDYLKGLELHSNGIDEELLISFIRQRYEYNGKIIPVSNNVETLFRKTFCVQFDFANNFYLINQLIDDFT